MKIFNVIDSPNSFTFFAPILYILLNQIHAWPQIHQHKGFLYSDEIDDGLITDFYSKQQAAGYLPLYSWCSPCNQGSSNSESQAGVGGETRRSAGGRRRGGALRWGGASAGRRAASAERRPRGGAGDEEALRGASARKRLGRETRGGGGATGCGDWRREAGMCDGRPGFGVGRRRGEERRGVLTGGRKEEAVAGWGRGASIWSCDSPCVRACVFGGPRVRPLGASHQHTLCCLRESPSREKQPRPQTLLFYCLNRSGPGW